MAAIDKTYGTKAESLAVHDWFKRHRPQLLRFHYGVDSYDHLDDDVERPIINTPTWVDRYLVRFCTARIVIERLAEVYSERCTINQVARERLQATTGNWVPTLHRVRSAA